MLVREILTIEFYQKGEQKMERYRITEEANLYFVTFTVVEWLPVFINETTLQILADSLNYCIEHKGLRVNAFVFIPIYMI